MTTIAGLTPLTVRRSLRHLELPSELPPADRGSTPQREPAEGALARGWRV